MSEKDYVSIILPTYNRGNLIMASIESVLKQTYKQLELIIVDDASTDNTQEIINTIKDNRIRYIRLEKNVGPAVARNIGVQYSKYELIAFEDSDDVWNLKKLEKQVPFINDETGLVYCSYDIESGTGKRICVPSKRINREDLSGDVFELLCKGNVIGTPTILVKKELLFKVGGFCEEIRSLEDWDLAFKLAEITKVKYIDEILVKAHAFTNGVNHDYLGRIKSEFHMMKKLKQKDKSIYGVLQCAMDDLQYLNEKNEQEEWKIKIRQSFFDSFEEFDFIWSIFVSRNKLKLRNSVLNKLCSNQSVNDYLQNAIDIKDNIGIYGLGDLGIALLEKLNERLINIECVIDRGVINYKEYKVVPVREIGETKVTKIIITIPEEFDNIANEINNYKNVECINIIQILNF